MSEVSRFVENWKTLTESLSEDEKASYPYLTGLKAGKNRSLEDLKKEASALLGKVSKDLKEKGQPSSDGIKGLARMLKTYYPGSGASRPGESTLDCPSPLRGLKLTFDDIAGNAEVKNQMKAGYIYPFIYQGLFAHLAKGVLLYGPPGTGKTLMAKAATKEIPNALFYGPSPAELKGKYLGDTEKNIHKVFECAEKQASKEGAIAIIFFDEFDSIGKDRGEGEGMAASVNTLLQEMDGIVVRPNVSVLAATNYPGTLDSAIRRRFPVRIFVDLPDEQAIEFKIREALANAYTPPGTGIRNKDGSVAVEEFYDPKLANPFPRREGGYMDSIKNHGGYEAKSKAGFFAAAVAESKYVDDDYIKKLVKRFGPTDEGKSFLREWKSGKFLECSDERIKRPEPIFGYSPADIDQIMNLAIKAAALRSLGFYCEKFGDGFWLAKYNLTKGASNRRADLVSDNQKAKVISFDIRTADIESAFLTNGSTIRNTEYYNLLHFSKFGVDGGC